jgi:hypothetical protein
VEIGLTDLPKSEFAIAIGTSILREVRNVEIFDSGGKWLSGFQ